MALETEDKVVIGVYGGVIFTCLCVPLFFMWRDSIGIGILEKEMVKNALETMELPEDAKVDVVIFHKDQHFVTRTFSKEEYEGKNIEQENYRVLCVTALENGDVTATYSNTVTVLALGVNGVYDTFGEPHDLIETVKVSFSEVEDESQETRKLLIENFESGAHKVEVVVGKDNINSLLEEKHEGYEITEFHYLDEDEKDVVIVYTNNVEVQAVGVDGVFDTFGVPVEKDKLLTYNK